MISLSPENQVHRAVQKLCARFRLLFGSRLVPAYRDTGLKDIHDKPLLEQIEGAYHRQFSHPVGSLLLGAPKRTGGAPTRYIVWKDGSLRKPSTILRSLPPEGREAFVKQLSEAAVA